MKKTIILAALLSLPFVASAQRVLLDASQLLQDVKVLSADSMGGRLSGSEGSKMAQEYIQTRFKQAGLKAFGDDYKQYFKINTQRVQVEQATNLVGYIAGKSGKAIVVTAHYDHVGFDGEEVFNGADDNASGVGALLAAATYFAKHPPKHTIIFAALDGEELGLQGAKAFLGRPPVPQNDILLNVNMDMLSINKKGELYASGAYHYPKLLPYLNQVKPRAGAKLMLGHDRPEQGHDDWTGQSDHAVFHKYKIPYVYFGVEDHPYYHKGTDEFKQINQQFYADAAGLVLDFLKVVDAKLGQTPLN
ncbi:M28 family peptidase [Pontibacter oryzae]|uniref:Peptidase M20 n=1 Tax=Pontibacter oryzae TaxID=2304593 RepID=A0A399RX69_9BACT|nr:M28 family peptidase [Pontibacter oryzae]RIJ34412.1 peptidase M20 [Pontibacter oryzae]